MNPTSYFSRRCSNGLTTKSVHNFLTKNPNGMNQSFTCRQKYNLWEKTQGKKIFKFYFYCPLSFVLNLFVHNFCSQATIEKKNVYFYEANPFSYLHKKFQKIMEKIQRVGT